VEWLRTSELATLWPVLDVVVIGAGHNGLTAAAYLARAGLRTLVVERRDVVGGACVSEELWPGFRVSRAAYVAGLLRPVVVSELGLRARGLELVRRSPSSFTPVADGRGLLLGGGSASDADEIAAFSRRDAARYPAYERLLDRCARTLEPMLDVPPPSLPRPGMRDLAPLARTALRALRLGPDLPRAFGLLLGAARPLLESTFESEPLRSTLATDAVIGAWASPSMPGTGYVLFHHVMGDTGGARGVWAYVRGGMGALSEAIADSVRSAGGEVRTGSPVARIALQDGRARGVVLEDGQEIAARVVVSGADPARTFLQWVDRAELDEDFAREVESLDFRSPSLKINLALDRLPAFRGRSGSGGTAGPEHAGTIHVGADSLDAIERSFESAVVGALPARPIVELTIPSALDSSVAPEGRHLASMFVQYVPYEVGRPGGGRAGLDAARASWDGEREAFADRVFALVDGVAPGFSESVIEREVLAPPDLEHLFGLTGGNIFHGAMSPDRLLFMRPLPGWARYRTPIEGLYLCGAGTHPGGGVMGACGRNAAREILRDLGRRP